MSDTDLSDVSSYYSELSNDEFDDQINVSNEVRPNNAKKESIQLRESAVAKSIIKPVEEGPGPTTVFKLEAQMYWFY